MKRYIIVVISFVFVSCLYSQDLILTSKGDSINCKITKIKSDYIYFTFKHKEEIRNTLLSVSAIKDYRVDYFTVSEVPQHKIVGYQDYKHFRISLNAGFSYQTAKIHQSVPSEFRNYVNDLKSAYHFGFDLSYFFSEYVGFGLKYSMFQSSNSMDNIYIEDSTGFREYGKMSDDIKISFFGPMISTRLLSYNSKNALIISLALGYMNYQNDKILVNKYIMSGNTFGLSIGIGYDIGLSEDLSLGFEISAISGTLFEYKWNDGKSTEIVKLKNGEYESLSRIDFSIGLRFSK